MPAQNKDDGGWKKFFWNSDTRECLGRTGGSWAKILLFYTIFYGCLSGIFTGTIQALLLTLNSYKPSWQDRISSPGLTHAPRSDKGDVIFAVNDVNTYLKYINSIKNFLEAYNDEIQRDQHKFEDCGDQPGGYKNRGDLDTEIGIRRACRFSKTLLGPCSGTEDQDFGFSEGKPCLIVKLNRIVYFRPEPPQSNESIPEEVKSKVQPNVIPLHCTSKKKEEEVLLGPVAYYGIGEGFPLQYYPYYGKLLHSHYLQPLVAIQFLNITLNQDIRIECKVYGENILQSDKDRSLGRFEVKIKVIHF
ncbi:sodium/potassium-transporting ATPase subunit beta-1b [Neoarius graeffei]|uniref:sodium/potassium-transporting ATPase subunit beta-1b n=1 Tax=Neoarius graeffei TaxID=443677 RepID=UPI00298C4640|nr:sodium/potassium-transporting ATPase subunit beta-1b [Neoarius graeffei]